MSRWQCRPVPLKFQLSDWTLFSVSLLLQVRVERPFDETLPVEPQAPPTDELMKGSQGFMVRGMPIAAELPPISRTGEYLCYVPLQYQHCYIDLGLSFEAYQKKFSSKARSTINRKLRKYSEHCGGTILLKTYKLPGEMRDFFRLARVVSQLSYQERLLDAGIPDSEDFIRHAELLAADQRIRAYILFDGERPVSYLYCPVRDGILNYAYLGYDPDYIKMSVGTVLQWLAVEQLFGEARFLYFDFTEGKSEHKRLFATHQRQCANIFLVKRTLRNTVVIYSHLLMNRFSGWIGATLDQLGVKAKIKRYLRFARL
ncbi:MAG TPA: GNAT family N-acetyltransferase [Rhodocyclaceae bacterium]|nr:GNAT family N-acetyltransferase [Rhodocyclaceae bacterium]HUY02652.1 GNAT family N-acetyltransferase [Rhodocyclaceae bacterium]